MAASNATPPPLTYEFTYVNGDTAEISGLTIEEVILKSKLQRTKQLMQQTNTTPATKRHLRIIRKMVLVEYHILPDGVERVENGGT